jgi:nitrite reductase/ring-hydroxylating ferredoxin subunit
MRFRTILGLGLCVSLGLANLGFAESFTLTREDGRVFYCSDQGGGPVYKSFTVCECFDAVYNVSRGQVIAGGGSNALDACRALTSSPRLSGCRTLQASSITCDCFDSTYNVNAGQVIGGSGTEVMSSCKSLTSSPKLLNCQAF